MRVLVTAALASVLLTGCGTADDRDQARDVVTRFYAALNADRAQVACAQLSDAARTALEDQEGRPCARAIGDLGLQGSTVVATKVYITNAKVDLADGDSAFLGREHAGWRLSAVGCKAENGKPRDRPLNCELEA